MYMYTSYMLVDRSIDKTTRAAVGFCLVRVAPNYYEGMTISWFLV